MRTPPFSERYGFTKPRGLIIDSLDVETRVALWNELHVVLLSDARHRGDFDQFSEHVGRMIWQGILKRPTHHFPSVIELERDFYKALQEATWYEAMNMIERCAEAASSMGRDDLLSEFDRVFEEYGVAYRFVGGTLTRLTEPEQVEEVERAIEVARKGTIAGARTHLVSALEKLGARPKPDERNAIKEAISAVEVVVRRIAGAGNTLSAALKAIDVDMSPALHGGLEKLYGWTNGPDGIRHAMMDESSLHVEDARFMVVTCSAFVNYLVAKADRAGVAF